MEKQRAELSDLDLVVILSGNQRYLAMEQLGWQSCHFFDIERVHAMAGKSLVRDVASSGPCSWKPVWSDGSETCVLPFSWNLSPARRKCRSIDPTLLVGSIASYPVSALLPSSFGWGSYLALSFDITIGCDISKVSQTHFPHLESNPVSRPFPEAWNYQSRRRIRDFVIKIPVTK